MVLDGNTYFRVVKRDALVTKHYIPIVEEMIPSVKPEMHHVMLTPPPGLLELGINEAKLKGLRKKLEPYALSENGNASRHWQQLSMPSRKLLKRKGQEDLIKEIDKVGGFIHVAGVLGLKSHRKPWGFWDNLENLDREISYFIASSWIEEEGKDGSFFYNKAINKIQWKAPSIPDALQNSGSLIVLEDPSERIMPTKTSIMNSGPTTTDLIWTDFNCLGSRWDLHHAISYNGGYRYVAEVLERIPASRASKPLHKIAQSLDVVRHFIQQHRIKSLPYLSVIKLSADESVVEAVQFIGGIKRTAQLLDMSYDHKPRPSARKRGPSSQKWNNIDIAVEHVAHFIHEASLKDAEGQGRMPTQHELIKADRYDLKYAIEKFGRTEIEARLGYGQVIVNTQLTDC